jgi:hypothetical protein
MNLFKINQTCDRCTKERYHLSQPVTLEHAVYNVYKLTMIGFIGDLNQVVFIKGTSWENSMTHNDSGEPELRGANQLKKILDSLG